MRFKLQETEEAILNKFPQEPLGEYMKGNIEEKR